jgi:hypothetical protein
MNNNSQNSLVDRTLLKYCQNWSVYKVYWISFIILTLVQILIILIIHSMIN